MNFDEETLIEIEDYINALHEQVGLSMNTLVDIDKAIGKKRKELKKLTIPVVNYCNCSFAMVMRDVNTDEPYCAECGKLIKELL